MEHKKQEDADLLLVIKSITKGISTIFKPINLFFVFTLKNIGILSIFSILFGALFVGFFYTQKPYYKSSLCISHNRLENDFCGEMITSLKLLAGQPSNDAVLAKKLGISEKYIHELKSIDYSPLNEGLTKLYSDTIEAKLPFKVRVEVYNIEVLDSLQKGILYYLESNEYVTRVRAIDSALLVKKERRLKNELSELDSLKLIVNKSIVPRSTGTGIILGEPINPVSIYNTSNYLDELMLETNKKQLLNKSFELMVEFTANKKSAGMGKTVFMFFGLLVGYIVGVVFLVRRKHLKEFKSN